MRKGWILTILLVFFFFAPNHIQLGLKIGFLNLVLFLYLCHRNVKTMIVMIGQGNFGNDVLICAICISKKN